MTTYYGGMGVGEGFNPATSYTVSTSTPEYPGAPVAVGTHLHGSDGSTWVFCVAGGSITANDAVLVTTNSSWTVQAMTSTLAKGKLGQRAGIAGATATSGQYLWVQTAGYNSSVNAVTGATAFTVLHSSATAGRLTATAVGGTSAAVTGIVILATAASNTAAAFITGAAIGADD